MHYFDKLNKIIVLQIPNTTNDGLGGIIIMWRDYLKTWSSFEQINHLSPQIRSHNFSKNFYKFILRKHHKISNKMRIIMNERVFNIEAVNECNANKAYLDIITYEKVKHDIRP